MAAPAEPPAPDPASHHAEALLATLRRGPLLQLRPSAIDGVGVFALTPIAAGTRGLFGPPDPPSAWLAVPHDAIAALPPAARALVETYCLFDEEQYHLPAQGFTTMNLALFLNHADVPNVRSLDDGNDFEALHDIAAGDELLIDYGAIVDEARAPMQPPR